MFILSVLMKFINIHEVKEQFSWVCCCHTNNIAGFAESIFFLLSESSGELQTTTCT